MAKTSSGTMASLLISRSPLFNGHQKNSDRPTPTTQQEVQELVITPVYEKAIVPVDNMKKALPRTTNMYSKAEAHSKATDVLSLLINNFSAILGSGVKAVDTNENELVSSPHSSIK